MKIRWGIILLSLGLFASSVGCAVFAYLWIDRSITLSYVEQSAETSNHTVKLLELLLENEWAGMPEDKVLQKLNLVASRHPAEKIIIKKDKGAIWFDEVRFGFESNRLGKVGRP